MCTLYTPNARIIHPLCTYITYVRTIPRVSGTFPLNFDRLSALTEMRFTSTKLSGALPRITAPMPALSTLRIGGTKIDGPLSLAFLMSPKLGRSSGATCTMSTTRRTTRFIFDVSWDNTHAQRAACSVQRAAHSA